MNKDDAGANYVLKVLLPRLEELKPGLLDELLHGVQADKDAVAAAGKMTPRLEDVFRSAESILGRAPL